MAKSKRGDPMMPRLILLTIVLPLLVASAEASGSYRGRPARAGGKIDAKKYSLGKRLFSGKIKLEKTYPELLEAQKTTVEELEQKLKRKLKRKTDREKLQRLPGKINKRQWASKLLDRRIFSPCTGSISTGTASMPQ